MKEFTLFGGLISFGFTLGILAEHLKGEHSMHSKEALDEFRSMAVGLHNLHRHLGKFDECGSESCIIRKNILINLEESH